MADEHIRTPNNPIPPTTPADASSEDRVAAGAPPAASAGPLFLPRAKNMKPAEHKDSFREVVETVVFVIVLVLLLKSFVAEAFVIPTGSMATTLLGYHKNVTCPECGHNFTVNCSKEADAQEQMPEYVTGCTCPNCRLHISFGGFRLPEGLPNP